jgi:hypothetical protein
LPGCWVMISHYLALKPTGNADGCAHDVQR